MIKRFRPLVLLLGLVLGVGAGVGQHSAQARRSQDVRPRSFHFCAIYLTTNTHTCSSKAIAFVTPLSGGQTVLRVTTTGYAHFTVLYNSTPTGWSFNIGDSSTNNGWAGDSGNQSNDAEMQVLDQTFSVYASDYGGGAHLFSAANVVQSSNMLSFKVSNNTLEYVLGNSNQGALQSPYGSAHRAILEVAVDSVVVGLQDVADRGGLSYFPVNRVSSSGRIQLRSINWDETVVHYMIVY